MRQSMRQSTALLMAAVLGAGSIPAAAVEIDAGETSTGGAPVVQTVTEWAQISDVIESYWREDYFGEITVDPEQNRAEMDGEKISLRKQFDLTRAQTADILDSAAVAEQYFEENTDYTSFTDNEGVVHVRDPYQTQRLLVYTDELAGDYGASEILHWAEYGEYFLQFDSREATQAAYEQLTAEVGTDHCFTDDVLTTDMLLGENARASSEQCVSWGTSYMGLDVLKEDVENDTDITGTATAAIIDTGIDTDHEMFEGRTITGYNFATNDGHAATDYEDTEQDKKGHGTHVAGVVTDCTPDNVQLMILRVFNTKGDALNSAVEAAIRYAGKHGADVVNMSIGSVQNPKNPYNVWDEALQELYNKDIAVFAAAGNEGEDHDKWGYSMNYPAVLQTTIAISALSKTGKLASFSSFGDTVEFAAPGSDIVSAARGGGLRTDSGTSMATPHMTGAGAYIKLLHPEYTVEDVRATLQSYAEDLGEVGRDEQYGYGAVHMENYLTDYKKGEHYLNVSGMFYLEPKYSKMTYTGKARKNPVTVKFASGEILDPQYYTVSYSNNTEIGIATVTVTGQNGYRGSLSERFSIIPQKTSITKLSNSGAGKMKVQWKTVAVCRGYQISYATKSSFQNAKKITIVGNKNASRTISKLKKGKRYYVRIRTYQKTTDGSIRGRWSDVKSVKITR